MYRLIITIAAVLLSIHNIKAQNQIVNTITTENLKKHIEILASDSLEGRKSGYEGENKAANYISSVFIENNIPSFFNTSSQPYYQSFEITSRPYSWREISFSMDDFYNWDHLLFAGNDSAYSDSITPHYAGILRNITDINISTQHKSIIFQTTNLSTTVDIIEHLRLTSNTKTFIVNFEQDKYFKKIEKEYHNIHGTFFKENNLNKNKSLIDYTKVYQENTEFEDILLKYTKKHTDIRVFIVDNKLLKELVGKNGNTIRNVNLYARHYDTLKTLTAKNVAGFIKGKTKPDEYIIVMAHYDHLGKRLRGDVYNGAYDNASSVSALIETAKAINENSKKGLSPDRSIIFLATTAEEIGLMGSKYFLYKSGINPKQVKAVINMDMIGRFDKKHDSISNYVYAIPHRKNKTKLKKALKYASANSHELEIDKRPGLMLRLSFNLASDQYHFIKNKIPAISFSTGLTSDYHTIDDIYDKLNYDNIKDITQFVYLTTWYLSSEENYN